MILQALNRYYERLVAREEPGLSAYGYSPEKISYEILLAPDGAIVDIADIRDTSGKKPFPRILNVPQPAKRTVAIKANFLWDKTSYVLGVSASSKRADKEHEAFKALHRQCLAGESDPGLHALSIFLESWMPANFGAAPFTQEMLDTNVVFRLDNDRVDLHDRPAAQAVWARMLTKDEESLGPVVACLVTGQASPVARLHPTIKGVQAAQSSGASIVSFNLDAFTSYGKTQGENAPMSSGAVFAYTTALNHLLRRGEHNRQRLQIGDATVVFWAEADDAGEAEAAERVFADLLSPPTDDAQEEAKLRRVLDNVTVGRPLREIDPQLHERTRMFVLGLAPNASRLSIRFWQVDRLEVFGKRLAEHEHDMRLQPPAWRVAPSAWRLALAAAPSRESRSKAEDVPPQLAGEMMRAILSGRRYPRSFFANVIMRMRSDGDLSPIRVAVCKGTLSRDRRLGLFNYDGEIPVSLDKNIANPGYRLGRLFAVLENAQRIAIGGQINATIRDRYYGAASATPALVFPMLLRNVQNHLAKVRKDKPGLAVNLERDMREIIDGLGDSLPRSLHLEDQGRFAIGYYHQAEVRFSKGEVTDAMDSGHSTVTSDKTGVAA